MPVAKKLTIINDAPRGYKAKWIGGGELPNVLKTSFTSRMEAQRAIDFFQSTKKKS